MSGDNKEPAGQNLGGSEDKTDAKKNILRFEQYTSPMLLGVLISAGHSMAAAAQSLPR